MNTRDEAPNYDAIYKKMDDDKDTTDYSMNERRAEIYKLIEELGDPSRLPTYQELSDKYGVVKGTVHNDVKRIKEHIKERMGEDVQVKLKKSLDRAVREKNRQGEPEEAFKLLMDYSDFLFEKGELDREPQKIEAEVSSSNVEKALELVDGDMDESYSVEDSDES